MKIKEVKNMKAGNIVLGLFIAVCALALSTFAAPKGKIVVMPDNLQGWSTADTTSGASVSFVKDPSAPAGNDAIQLMTDNTNESTAQLAHSANVALSAITELSYFTKQVSAPFSGGDPYYQLGICLDGFDGNVCRGFTNLIYEPYWNGTVVGGVWQQWNVAAGRFWSSQSYSNETCSVTAGAGGAPFYNLADLQAACPRAVVIGFGVGVGTYNPGYVVETDLVNFNGTTYDFETRGNRR